MGNFAVKEPLHNPSRVRVDRIGMGRKADFAANSTAIGKKFNAADRPSPVYHGPRGVVQRLLNSFGPSNADAIAPQSDCNPILHEKTVRFIINSKVSIRD